MFVCFEVSICPFIFVPFEAVIGKRFHVFILFFFFPNCIFSICWQFRSERGAGIKHYCERLSLLEWKNDERTELLLDALSEKYNLIVDPGCYSPNTNTSFSCSTPLFQARKMLKFAPEQVARQLPIIVSLETKHLDC